MHYNQFDAFWDDEAYENIYTNAHYYPNGENIGYFYLTSKDFPFDLSDKTLQQEISSHVSNFIETNGSGFHVSPQNVTFLDMSKIENACSYIQAYGFADNDILLDKSQINNIVYPDRIEDLTHVQALMLYAEAHDYLPKDWFYPTKDTDLDYNKNLWNHNRKFGYNSTNYDLTLESQIIYELVEHIHSKIKHAISAPMLQAFKQGNTTELVSAIKNIDWTNFLDNFDATYIRKQFNDRMFDEYKSNMAGILNEDIRCNQQGSYVARNFRNEKTSTRKALLLTNRYIDVSRLNEKMSKVALKRIEAYLGLTIKEDDTSVNPVIKTKQDLINLFVYNASDVVCLRSVLEHSAYAIPYDLHTQLLERYPQVIYKDKGDKITPNVNPSSVRYNRLTIDSTSAKFVEFIVAPYEPLTDNPVVSFMYPSKTTIKRLKRERGIDVKQFDVLEYANDWYHEHVTNDPNQQAYKDWAQIYNFYSDIRGKNFNIGKAYQEEYGNQYAEDTPDSNYIKKLMEKYNTNIFYYNKDLTPSSCYATLSIGGIHGAEIHKALYDYDCKQAEEYNKIIDELKSMTKTGTVEETLNTLKPRVTLKNGTEVVVRSYIKNPKKTPNEKDMAKEHPWGEWKVKNKPALFSLKKKKGDEGSIDTYKYELNDRYKYVSIGTANHEDFASYYPLLLSMLSAFENVKRGLNEHGEPIDVYYQLYETRLKEKIRSKDKSLPDLERELANTTQLLMKLLINAASGVGDGTFDTNLRVNNKVIAMRIIGQLFSFIIGQAETLAGATVPSTNTDGLYTMNISPEENDKILFDTVKPMLVDIEPEVLTNFISKDSNNRLEVVYDTKKQKDIIAAANGGSLTAWGGPEPTNNLAHPAIVDRILAEYLWKKDNASNHPFDREFASEIYFDFLRQHMDSPEHRLENARFLQWVLSSSNTSHRYVYQKITTIDENGNTTSHLKPLQHINRAFIVRESYIKTQKYANEPIVAIKTYIAARDKNKPKTDTNDAVKIHKANGYFAHKENKYSKTVKVTGLPDTATLLIDNDTQKRKCAQNNYDDFGADFFENVIDHEQYIDLVQTTFEKSWYNKQEAEFTPKIS